MSTYNEANYLDITVYRDDGYIEFHENNLYLKKLEIEITELKHKTDEESRVEFNLLIAMRDLLNEYYGHE